MARLRVAYVVHRAHTMQTLASFFNGIVDSMLCQARGAPSLYDHIYLSPHRGTVVHNCGGRIWRQTQKGLRVQVVVLFSGAADLTAALQCTGVGAEERTVSSEHGVLDPLEQYMAPDHSARLQLCATAGAVGSPESAPPYSTKAGLSRQPLAAPAHWLDPAYSAPSALEREPPSPQTVEAEDDSAMRLLGTELVYLEGCCDRGREWVGQLLHGR